VRDHQEVWEELCQQASVKQDREKVLKLALRINVAGRRKNIGGMDPNGNYKYRLATRRKALFYGDPTDARGFPAQPSGVPLATRSRF
jgi:hypothetical protein